MMDLTGKIILHDEIPLNRGVNYAVYNENLSSGVYLISCTLGDQTELLRINVVR